jgi:ERCC4-type nuclease
MSEILLDNRVGSGDLYTYFKQWRVPYTLTRLPFGDAAVEATTGPYSGAIGIEIKKVRDTLQCMRDGRFAGHQLPGLIEHYSVVWLIIEGSFGLDLSSGVLTTAGRGGRRQPLRLGKSGPGFLYAELDSWLTTLEIKAGMRVRRTGSRVETAKFIADQRVWWEKDWDKHKSHLALHHVRPDSAMLVKPTIARKVAAQLPGIGWARSAEIIKHFPTVKEMVEAGRHDWMHVDGIGKTLADSIMEALRGPNRV